jgi:hypothetical protein
MQEDGRGNPLSIANRPFRLALFRQPIHPIFLPIPIVCFIGVLLTDLTFLVVSRNDVHRFLRMRRAVLAHPTKKPRGSRAGSDAGQIGALRAGRGSAPPAD